MCFPTRTSIRGTLVHSRPISRITRYLFQPISGRSSPLALANLFFAPSFSASPPFLERLCPIFKYQHGLPHTHSYHSLQHSLQALTLVCTRSLSLSAHRSSYTPPTTKATAPALPSDHTILENTTDSVTQYQHHLNSHTHTHKHVLPHRCPRRPRPSHHPIHPLQLLLIHKPRSPHRRDGHPGRETKYVHHTCSPQVTPVHASNPTAR